MLVVPACVVMLSPLLSSKLGGFKPCSDVYSRSQSNWGERVALTSVNDKLFVSSRIRTLNRRYIGPSTIGQYLVRYTAHPKWGRQWIQIQINSNVIFYSDAECVIWMRSSNSEPAYWVHFIFHWRSTRNIYRNFNLQPCKNWSRFNSEIKFKMKSKRI